MSGPGVASFPIPPVLTKLPFVTPNTGLLTQIGFGFLQQVWAGIQAPGGLVPSIDTLTAAVIQLQDMTGDATFNVGTGVITVTKTNGVSFGYFATGTDASHLTGTIAFARLPAPLNSEAGGTLLGRASSAGTPQEVGIGDGLGVSGTNLITEDSEVTTVAALPAQPYRAGARRFVSDAAAAVFAAAVTGGGAIKAPVYSDGAQWLVG
jgi:hypothetical protein